MNFLNQKINIQTTQFNCNKHSLTITSKQPPLPNSLFKKSRRWNYFKRRYNKRKKGTKMSQNSSQSLAICVKLSHLLNPKQNHLITDKRKQFNPSTSHRFLWKLTKSTKRVNFNTGHKSKPKRIGLLIVKNCICPFMEYQVSMKEEAHAICLSS